MRSMIFSLSSESCAIAESKMGNTLRKGNINEQSRSVRSGVVTRIPLMIRSEILGM